MIAVEELKEALKIASDDDSEIDFLEQCEAAAVAYVELVTGRTFGPVGEVTEYFPTEMRELWLSGVPLADPAPVVTLDGVTIDADSYTVRGRRLTFALPQFYGAPRLAGSEVAVTYTAGYAEGREPADARQCVLWLVTQMYEQRNPAAETIAGEMPHHLSAFLRARRRIPA